MGYDIFKIMNGLEMFVDTIWIVDIDADEVWIVMDKFTPEQVNDRLTYSKLGERYVLSDIKSYDFSDLYNKFSEKEMRKMFSSHIQVRRYELCVKGQKGLDWFEVIVSPVYENDGHCRVSIMSRLINTIKQNDIITNAVEEAYDYIMYVDMNKNNYIAYLFNTENGKPLPPVISFDYDKAMFDYNNKYVAPYELEKAHKNFNRQNILDELKDRDTYSFFVDIVENGKKQTKIINALYYDNKNQIVLITRSDITNVRDERQQALSIALSNTNIHEFCYYINEARCEISDRTIDKYNFQKVYTNMPYSFMQDFVFEDDRNDFEEMYKKINSGDYSTANCVFRDKSGETWIKQTLTVIPSHSGHMTFAIGIIEDITSQKKMEFRAERDQFTGLYNKTSAMTIIQMIMQRAPQDTHYMFVIDLDNFKQVNDMFGHAVGDVVLIKTATMLRAMFRSNDVVARFGGDEFLIFTPRVNDINIIYAKAEMIIETIRNEIGNEYPEAHLTTSMGIACSDEKMSVGNLFKAADIALYKAKQSGKNKYCISMSGQQVEQR